ncbi:MAG: Na+/H+ antiporter NhaC family protein, partial [Halanaerobiaceae bacterium]
CNQLLAVFLPGKMFRKKYDEMNIHRKYLGRALGDSGLIVSPLIPWNVNALMMTSVLGVTTFDYFFYAFLPLLLPMTGIIMGYIGSESNNK